MPTPDPPIPLSVFVIDDYESIRETLRLLLEQRGLEVEVYASPEEFLRGYRVRSRGCLLLDQQLDGSTGLDFIQSIEWRMLGLPTILMTGAGSKELRLHAMRAGAVGYVEKPFDGASLIATIYDAVRPVHNRTEINRVDLEDPAPASQAVLTLKSRSTLQRIERITTRIRQLIQFLKQGAQRSHAVARSHQSGVSDRFLSDEFETRAEKPPMPDATPIIGATFIDEPRHGDLRALYQYWDTIRRGRVMPQRADIDPTEIPDLLPYVIVYAVLPGGGGYQIHLVGEEITHFVGQNLAGRLAGSFMMPCAAEMMIKILDAVAKERVPKFRAGKAYWHAKKTDRDFEACFLPLSSDGETANLILGGIKTGL